MTRHKTLRNIFKFIDIQDFSCFNAGFYIKYLTFNCKAFISDFLYIFSSFMQSWCSKNTKHWLQCEVEAEICHGVSVCRCLPQWQTMTEIHGASTAAKLKASFSPSFSQRQWDWRCVWSVSSEASFTSALLAHFPYSLSGPDKSLEGSSSSSDGRTTLQKTRWGR